MRVKQDHGIALFMGLLFTVFGGIGVVGSWRAYTMDTGIVKSGVKATAHITGKSFLFVSDGDSDFIVDYWFQTPDGKRIETHRAVSEKTWRTLKKGGTLVVAYSISDPKRNFPLGGGVTSLTLTVFVSAFSAPFLVFGILLVMGALRPANGEQ